MEEARRRKSEVEFAFIRTNCFLSKYMRIGVRKLLRTGSVLARAWKGQAVGVAPTKRLTLRRQMAAAGGKESVALSLFRDVNNLEVEKELSNMASACLGGRGLLVKNEGKSS